MAYGLSWWSMRHKALRQMTSEDINNEQLNSTLSGSSSHVFATESNMTTPNLSPITVIVWKTFYNIKTELMPCSNPNSIGQHVKQCTDETLHFSATDSDVTSTNERNSLFHLGMVYDDFGYKNCISSSVEEETPLSLKEKLFSWGITFNVSNTSFASLLDISRDEHPDLPKDSRTLRSISQSIHLKSVAGGQYFHLGLKKGIISKLMLISQHQPEEFRRLKQLCLQFNVDGLPLFKRVRGEFCPILCLIENILCKIPFAVGIYYGKQKPTNVDEYFTAFIS